MGSNQSLNNDIDHQEKYVNQRMNDIKSVSPGIFDNYTSKQLRGKLRQEYYHGNNAYMSSEFSNSYIINPQLRYPSSFANGSSRFSYQTSSNVY